MTAGGFGFHVAEQQTRRIQRQREALHRILRLAEAPVAMNENAWVALGEIARVAKETLEQ